MQDSGESKQAVSNKYGLVEVAAQVNWWRRQQPQTGWWGAEASHTYGPLCLWGSLYMSWSSMGADNEMEC